MAARRRRRTKPVVSEISCERHLTDLRSFRESNVPTSFVSEDQTESQRLIRRSMWKTFLPKRNGGASCAPTFPGYKRSGSHRQAWTRINEGMAGLVVDEWPHNKFVHFLTVDVRFLFDDEPTA